ncbi:MAG: AAA family ATPase [Gammaproteobacteria bacterium]|nr:AAA family ATPase [Gammaproteobacteria bacterium]
MIVFLFGTWGSGKTYLGELIQRECGLLHMEADIQFDNQMLNALHARNYHQLDLTKYYQRVVHDMFNFQRTANDFIVSQGIYHEHYRKMIFDVFEPDIRFVWVKSEDLELHKERLNRRAEQYGNPITADVYDYMLSYWEAPQIPHVQLVNAPNVGEEIKSLLHHWGLCLGWDD